MKTLKNTDINGTKKNVSDVKVFGDGDAFKLICKAWSEAEGWMKSTKAMEISGAGTLVQVSTQQGDNVAESLTFVPGAFIQGTGEDRQLVADDFDPSSGRDS